MTRRIRTATAALFPQSGEAAQPKPRETIAPMVEDRGSPAGDAVAVFVFACFFAALVIAWGMLA